MKLRTKFILLIAGIALSIGVLSSFLVGRLVQRAMEKDLREKGVVLAQTLAELITNDVINRDLLHTREDVNEIVQTTEGVAYIYVIGFDGAVFAHTFKEGFPRDLASVIGEKKGRDNPFFNEYRTGTCQIIEVGYTLISGMRASIHIGLNKNSIRTEIQSIRNRIIGITLAIVLPSIFLGVVLSRRITLPLGRLAQSMEAFGEGKAGEPFSVSSGGWEVARLAQSFNHMIADRRRMEEDLLQEKHLSDTIIDSLPGTFYVIDKEANLLRWNKNLENASGYSAEELSRIDTLALVVPEDKELIAAKIQEVFSTGKAVAEAALLTRSGKRIPFYLTGVLARLGDAAYLLGVGWDLTDRKQSEEEAAKARARLEYLISSSPAVIYTCEVGGNWPANFMSKNVRDILGYDYHEAIENPAFWVNCIHPEDRARVLADLDRLIEKCHHVHEYRFLHKNGTYRWLHDEVKIVRNADGKPLECIGYIVDVTERKRMEEELLKTEKLESLGILAGGLAHDFNNLLTAILGNISLAKLYSPSAEKTLERLEEAERASLKARELTQQLLTFSKGGLPVKKPLSLAGIINDSSCFALRGSGTRCEISVPDDLWPIEADEGQIGQVIHNLAINAAQAMPEGGTVRLCCENVRIAPQETPPLAPGPYVKISIQDQGIGIPQEHVKKIFEPYFTTKQKGSGLGLATSYSIIKNHNGLITVDSRLGAGTTFTIYLPASETTPPSSGRSEEALVPGTGRVLLMDDEEMVINVAREMLGRLGYDVECVENGEKAVERYKTARESGRPFDAVIMDLTIPGGMGGKEAIKKLLEIDPGVKAIVSSGYSNDPVMADFRASGFCGVVTKPYRIQTLSKAIADVVAKNTTPPSK